MLYPKNLKETAHPMADEKRQYTKVSDDIET